jgi:FixJ family two-component response regulator
VFIVDDDPGIRFSLSALLQAARFETACFGSAEDFLDVCSAVSEGCMLLDIRMPGIGGMALQTELGRRNIRLPIIFLTGHGTLTSGVEAIKQGALDFLTKPVNGTMLLERVTSAMQLDRERRAAEATRNLFGIRLARLTPREREVLVLALSGIESREIASRLQISPRTVDGHRSRIYLKTGAESLLSLVQQAANAGVALAETLIQPQPDAV